MRLVFLFSFWSLNFGSQLLIVFSVLPVIWLILRFVIDSLLLKESGFMDSAIRNARRLCWWLKMDGPQLILYFFYLHRKVEKEAEYLLRRTIASDILDGGGNYETRRLYAHSPERLKALEKLYSVIKNGPHAEVLREGMLVAWAVFERLDTYQETVHQIFEGYPGAPGHKERITWFLQTYRNLEFMMQVLGNKYPNNLPNLMKKSAEQHNLLIASDLIRDAKEDKGACTLKTYQELCSKFLPGEMQRKLLEDIERRMNHPIDLDSFLFVTGAFTRDEQQVAQLT
jgi:hypothetical protein